MSITSFLILVVIVILITKNATHWHTTWAVFWIFVKHNFSRKILYTSMHVTTSVPSLDFNTV